MKDFKMFFVTLCWLRI